MKKLSVTMCDQKHKNGVPNTIHITQQAVKPRFLQISGRDFFKGVGCDAPGISRALTRN